MPDLDKPFSEAQLNELRESLLTADKIEAAIKKAQRAGIPVEGQLERNRANRERIQKILHTYGGG